MSQRPQNTDPIASAGQIDDPDQSANINGEQPPAGAQSRDGGVHPSDTTDDGHPDRFDSTSGGPHRTSGGGDTVNTHALHDDGVTVTSLDREQPGEGHKFVKETGFPNVPAEEVEAQNRREIDSESLAGERKFQPREGDDNPNVSNAPTSDEEPLRGQQGGGLSEAARNDRDGDESEAETYGTPENTPRPEPVQHSRVVEERIQRQERDYDLNVTEEGERYITPSDLQ